MFASQLTSNYNEKKSSHEIQKLPVISQSPRNDIAHKSLIKVYDTGLESRRASAFCQLCALKINAC